MLDQSYHRLLSLSSPELVAFPLDDSSFADLVINQFSLLGNELIELLKFRNGFFAFESALNLYPLGESLTEICIQSWNESALWRQSYGNLIDAKVLFFGQDAFGNQFGINCKEVILFFSETAEVEVLANSLFDWLGLLMDDWRGFTGYNLAHEWQKKNRSIKSGERLIPKFPFVLGGEYNVDNLYCGSILEAQKFRAGLARQIVSIPDGTSVKVNIRGLC